MQNLIYDLLKDEKSIQNFKPNNSFTCSDENSEALLIATSFLSFKKNIVIIKNSLYSAQRLYDRLISFLNDQDIYLYPSNESLRLDAIAESKEFVAERVFILNRILGTDYIFNSTLPPWIYEILPFVKLLPPLVWLILLSIPLLALAYLPVKFNKKRLEKTN